MWNKSSVRVDQSLYKALMTDIANNLAQIQQRIALAAENTQRNPSAIALLAVSKTKPIEMIEAAYAAGQSSFGENYLQDALPKIEALAGLDIEWHYIGRIQSNKTRPIAENFSYREIDVEVARWGNASDPTNAQFVVQPWHHYGNLHRYTIPSGSTPTTYGFDWEADQIAFVSHDGAFLPPPESVPVISQWTYTGPDIPVPGDEQVRMNLWLVNGNPPTDGQEVEVVISRHLGLHFLQLPLH